MWSIQVKKFVAIAFAAASLLAGPAVLLGTSSSAFAQQQCEGNVPEAWKRPGGYCEQLNNLGSTIEQPDDECNYQLLISSLELEYGESVLVAEDCNYYPPN
jgi:hypothetical protein